jgi:hypothetical protein
MGEERSVYRVLVGKAEGKRPLGRSRCRWKDNYKIDFGKWDVEIRTTLSWRKHVIAVMKHRVQ